MEAVKFAEEFTQLLCRWRKSVTKEDGTTAPLLTDQQIISVMQNVQQVILGVNFQLPDYSTVKTPATGIEVCTPSAPTVPKSTMDSNNVSLGRYRSLDTLIAEDKEATPKVEDLVFKNQENESINKSLSNMEINTVIKVTRSDTFVREQEKAKQQADQAANKTFTDNETSLFDLQRIVKKIEELRECAAHVVSKIDDVKKDVCPQSSKPIRRLSSISFPGSGRSTSLLRPIPPSNLRRLSSGFPGTPTSSKFNPTLEVEKITSSSRRRSTVAPTIKSSANSTAMSRSPSVASATFKKSPGTTGNPKYAHVQSTIPKLTTTKRKA